MFWVFVVAFFKSIILNVLIRDTSNTFNSPVDAIHNWPLSSFHIDEWRQRTTPYIDTLPSCLENRTYRNLDYNKMAPQPNRMISWLTTSTYRFELGSIKTFDSSCHYPLESIENIAFSTYSRVIISVLSEMNIMRSHLHDFRPPFHCFWS